MAAKTVLNYLPRKSVVHDLAGTTKLIFFLLFSFASMLTYDTRVLFVLFILSFVLLKISKIKIREVAFMFTFLLVFLAMNNLLLFIFNPEHGPELYNSRTVLFHIAGKYDMTAEQLFYQFNVTLKYLTALPIAILFISATDPSEFASSLNGIGVSYRIGYAVALALRYIPDIQRDYHEISQAQQARGVELGRDVKLTHRIKNSINILLPLVISSLNRIDVISNAMELRSFGQHEKRTWYTAKKMKKNDFIAIVLGIIILAASIIITYWDGNRFYNPFI